MISKILSFSIRSIHTRSQKAVTNIIYSFLLKGISIVNQFALIPLTIDYLNEYNYGIWLTLASIFGWFSFFDIGLGNGLRNKLAEALAQKNNNLAKTYISTAYAIVVTIFVSLILIFNVVNPLLNWYTVLNIDSDEILHLSQLTLIIFTFFSIRFILELISSILLADQRTALAQSIGPLGNLLAYFVIYYLKHTTPPSLLYVSVSYSGAPLIILLFFNIYFFASKYKNIRPSFKYINLSHSKPLFNLGVQFFIIQIAFIITYSTSNIILINFFGPQEVTYYNIAFKYFSSISLIFATVVSPYWSAITEAYVNKDLVWIKNTIRRLYQIALFLILILIMMYLLSDFAYEIWIGKDIPIPWLISLGMAVYFFCSILAMPYNFFINGVGKIRLQLITSLITIVLTIPLAYFYCIILKIGPAGVIFAPITTTLPTVFLWRIQYKKIIENKATGIWDK